MDTQVHNTWPLTCAQHKNFVNMSEVIDIRTCLSKYRLIGLI